MAGRSLAGNESAAGRKGQTVKRKYWIAFCSTFLLLTGAQLLALQNLSADRIKLKMEGSTIFFSENGRTHEVSVEGQFDAVRMDSAKLLAAKEAGNFVYLLLDVTGPSKLPRDKSQCGATNESDLIWLKLDSGWHLKEGVSFLYNSCLLPITMVKAPNFEGEVMTATTNSQSATYDNAHPEAGLKIEAVAAAAK
jgi:hypothetical protein